jgi:hypothetical protein
MTVAQENRATFLRAIINNREGDQLTIDDLLQAVADIEDNANAIAALGGGTSLTIDSISDITITSANTGDVLTYNGAEWVNQPGGGGGIPDAPTDGQQYARNGQTASWEVVAGGIPDAPADGQQYARNGQTASWEVVAGGGGGESNTASNLAGTLGVQVFGGKSGVDLGFRNIVAGANPATGQTALIFGQSTTEIVVYIDDARLRTSQINNDAGYIADANSDGTEYVRKDGAWVPNSGGGGGATTLDALTDTDIPSPNNGEVLTYNGVKWESAPVVAGGSGNLLTGTVIEWAGATVPVGYLLCDGKGFETSLYPDLYAAIGETYSGQVVDLKSGGDANARVGGTSNILGRVLNGIACSADGTRLAWVRETGSQNAVSPNFDVWVQTATVDTATGIITTGDSINATGVTPFGFSPNISMSDDGLRIAVGFPYEEIGGNNDVGRVLVYEWNGAFYDLIFNQPGVRSVVTEYFGWDVAISGDGNHLIVGTGIIERRWYHFYDNGGGFVQNQVTNGALNWYGSTIAISSNGSVLVVGDPTNNRVEVWRNTGGVGPAGIQQFGVDVTIGGTTVPTTLTLSGATTTESIGDSNTIGITSDGSRLLLGSFTSTEAWVVDISPSNATEYLKVPTGSFSGDLGWGPGDTISFSIIREGTHISLGNYNADTVNGVQSGQQLWFDITSGSVVEVNQLLNFAVGAGAHLGESPAAMATTPSGKVIVFGSAPDADNGPNLNAGLIISSLYATKVPDVNSTGNISLAKKIIKT